MERHWNDLTLKSLREIAKENELIRYSRLNKKDLIRFLQRELRKQGLSPSDMQSLIETKPLSARSPARRVVSRILPSEVFIEIPPEIVLDMPPPPSVSAPSEAWEEYADQLSSLPNEVILMILRYLDRNSLRKLCKINRRFFLLCKDPKIQKKLTKKLYQLVFFHPLRVILFPEEEEITEDLFPFFDPPYHIKKAVPVSKELQKFIEKRALPEATIPSWLSDARLSFIYKNEITNIVSPIFTDWNDLMRYAEKHGIDIEEEREGYDWGSIFLWYQPYGWSEAIKREKRGK